MNLEPKDSPRIKIDDCVMSVRTSNALTKLGYIYLDELQNVSSKLLLFEKCIGKKVLQEIREILLSHNLCLSDESNSCDVQKMILINIPEEIEKIRSQIDSLHAQMNDATKNLRYLCYKLEDLCVKTQRERKKI